MNSQIKGSDYLNYTETQKKAFRLIVSGENPIFGLFVLCGISYALRVSDLRKLTWGDIRSDVIRIKEQKTGKTRVIQNSTTVKLALKYFDEGKYPSNWYVFMSQKGGVFSSQHLNRLMKRYFGAPGVQVSTHSLRKTFARDIFDRKGNDALPYLQIVLNHSSPSTTMCYLGIRHEELTELFTETTSPRFDLAEFVS